MLLNLRCQYFSLRLLCIKCALTWISYLTVSFWECSKLISDHQISFKPQKTSTVSFLCTNKFLFLVSYKFLFYFLLTGFGLGPTLDFAIAINPQIIVTAFLATSVIFVCFSLSALWAQRRTYLYLGGKLNWCINNEVI